MGRVIPLGLLIGQRSIPICAVESHPDIRARTRWIGMHLVDSLTLPTPHSRSVSYFRVGLPARSICLFLFWTRNFVAPTSRRLPTTGCRFAQVAESRKSDRRIGIAPF